MREDYINLAKRIVNRSFRDKTDLAGKPYTNHIYRVFESVESYGPNGETKIIAILHDLLEDCPEWNQDVLRHFFPDSVVDAVQTLTKRKGEEYFDYIKRIISYDVQYAKYVKLADLKDNMDLTRLDTITDKDLERVKKYHQAYKMLEVI